MRKFLTLIILAIFIVPLSSMIPLRGQPIWYGQYLGLLFFLFLGMSVVLWQFNRWLSILTLLCLCSTFITRMSPRSIVLLFQLDLACLASYGISRFGREHRKIILWTIIGLMFLQGLWLALQANNIPIKIETEHINTDLTFISKLRPGQKELVGFSGSPDQIGTFFALTLPITLHTFWPLVFLSLAGLVVSKSSFAAVAGIISGLIYLFFIKKWFVVSLVLCILFSGVFFLKVDKLKSADFQTRFRVWEHSIKTTLEGKIRIEIDDRKLQIETNPWVGFGFGNFLRLFPYVPAKIVDNKFNYRNEKFTHAHNDFIEAFFELGYLGLICMIGLVGNFIRKFWRIKYDNEAVLYFSCISVYLLNSLGNFCSQLAVSGLLIAVFYGLYKGVMRENG